MTTTLAAYSARAARYRSRYHDPLARRTMADTNDDGLITDEMRAQIGVESAPWDSEVDKTWVRMFARSVGHTDPVYFDEAAAKAAGYRSLPCPPGYLGTPVFNPNAKRKRPAERASGDTVYSAIVKCTMPIMA